MFRAAVLSVSVAILYLPTSLAQAFVGAHFQKTEIHASTDRSNRSNDGIVHKIAVIGDDDRDFVPYKYKTLSKSIGVLYQSGGKGSWECTAFCVAPNVIATNAHCVVQTPKQRKHLDLGKVQFVLPSVLTVKPRGDYFFMGYSAREDRPVYVNSNSAIRKSKLQIVDPKHPTLSIFSGNYRGRSSVQRQGQDWAIAKLASPVCEGRSLKFEDVGLKTLKNAARRKKVFMIGFHGDTNMRHRRYSGECRVYSRDNKRYFPHSQRKIITKGGTLLPHSCDGVQGSSGSPIFMSTRNGPKVVGINLGSFGYSQYIVTRNRKGGRVIGQKKLQYRREINMAVQPHAFMNGIARFQNETLLSNLDSFKDVQFYLKILGYYAGEVDGILGQKTREAIVRFEKQHNLAELGLPTQQLLSQLQAEVEFPEEMTTETAARR